MKIIVKKINIKSLVVGLLMFLGLGSYSQMSYEEFHAKYVPHYETIVADAEIVKITNESDAETAALIVEVLMEQAKGGDDDSRLKLLAIITSCKRSHVGAILKELDTDKAVDFLNYAKYEWQREAMFFVDKITYHNLAGNLVSMVLYQGPTGPFGPEVKGFSPAYAGIGLDLGYGFYRGVNEYVDAYNGWTSKGTNPVYDLTEPVTKINTSMGFGAMAAFYLKNKGLLELNYTMRSAKGSGGGITPVAWTKDIKFSTHNIGINYLKMKDFNYSTFKFAQGFGAHFQIGGASERNSITNPKWAKMGSDFTAGVNYQAGLFINPFKKIPVMFGLRGYAQFNILKHDVNYMETYSPQLAWGGSGDEKLKSVMNVFGAQVQVMYKFGKKTDDKQYTDFETEVAENVDPHVNTSYSEILPVVSPDGKTLYFIRSDHPQNHNGSMNSQDVWYADITNGLESATANKMSDPLNQQQYNMIAGVSPDGNSMMIKGVFDSNGDLLKRGYSMIYRTATGWSKPKACDIDGYEDMSKGSYVGAYWTQDGKHLVMSFSESKEDDSQDLYVSHVNSDGSWSKPIKLGKTINTTGDDHSPFLASDGKTLYFSSDREGGLGNNDIWMSKREDDSWTKWSEPVNLGDEINTDSWDAYYSIDAQGKYAYMASSKNSKGQEDIVRIKLKEELQPDPVILISGKVLNQKTNEPLDATISYNGLVDGKNYGVARTNPATGEYTIVLPYGKNYDFTAGALNFIGVSDNLDLTDIGEYKEIKRDLYLVPIEVGATVRLNNIFFETGKDELKTESFSELKRVVSFLNDNPKVKIEVSGHTDNVGDKGFNKSLSQKRAQAVLDFLTKNGIDASRLVSQGYGMEKPVADNSTDEGRAMNRRVEFTILEN